MNVISEKEYSFSNALFWNVMLHHHIQAFDEERDVNFDEVWDEELVLTLLDKKKYKKYWCWLSQIDLKTSENQGEIENPRTLTLPIGSDIVLTIEFHPCCTYYFFLVSNVRQINRLQCFICLLATYFLSIFCKS